MKRTLTMIMIISSLAFGRDFEVRERNELNEVMNYIPINQEAIAREGNLLGENMEFYSEFHRELENMDRGHDDRD